MLHYQLTPYARTPVLTTQRPRIYHSTAEAAWDPGWPSGRTLFTASKWPRSPIRVGVGGVRKSREAPGQWQFLNLHLQTSARLCKRMSHNWLGSVSSRSRKGAWAQLPPRNPGRWEGGAHGGPREPRALARPLPSSPCLAAVPGEQPGARTSIRSALPQPAPPPPRAGRALLRLRAVSRARAPPAEPQLKWSERDPAFPRPPH